MTEQQTEAHDLEQAPAGAADGAGPVRGEGPLWAAPPDAAPERRSETPPAALPEASSVTPAAAIEPEPPNADPVTVVAAVVESDTSAAEPALPATAMEETAVTAGTRAADPEEAAIQPALPIDDGPPAEPLEETPEEPVVEDLTRHWYILKVQVNREDSIREALLRRVKIAGLDRFFGDIVVPTEDVAEFNKSGKRRVVKKKLYPGYLLVNLAINEETWFLIRETPGVGDFTGSGGRPSPMDQREVDRILRLGVSEEEGGSQVRTAIPFKAGDRVRVKEGNFQNFEGEVETIDEANGSITVIINIFGRSVPVELKHWQLEAV